MGVGDLDLVSIFAPITSPYSAGVYAGIAHRPSCGDERPFIDCELGRSRDPCGFEDDKHRGSSVANTRCHHTFCNFCAAMRLRGHLTTLLLLELGNPSPVAGWTHRVADALHIVARRLTWHCPHYSVGQFLAKCRGRNEPDQVGPEDSGLRHRLPLTLTLRM